MKQKIGKWLSILLPILLGLALVIYTYSKFTPEQIEEIKLQFKNADYFYIYISLLISALALWSRGYRWKYTLEHLGYKPKISTNVMAVCIGYFINMSIPRSGEVSRALILKKYEDVPFDKAFGTIIAERVVDSFFLLSFIGLAFFLELDVLKAFVLDKIPFQKLMLILGTGTFIMIGIILMFRYSNFRLIQTIKQKISGLMDGVFSIWKMEKKWAFLFHSLLIWASYFFMFYITIFALPETSNLSLSTVVISFIVGGLAITLTNSGFGAYPFLIAEILLLYNVPETSGTAFGWLVWTSQTLMVVILGTLSFLLLPILNKSK
ncbi:MAG TPA: lysylphosphatidylglycerol synthase transmembrane domain-containing protein [Flavobacterium sp.]|nr:flippase-like domain-containing protein [Flavobacterium sp.]HQV35014.1 lysylphosphatidylglycerol synthase transmembrane domain-containing protein [Flavobacterium sp.]HQX03020.1 lysylphosphatidylglycerol synthase transmembrane domain-containing protein [Flavobacterium sp.]HRZ30885.1 lysylphosphatidylglycerol synthase transmembrane domain-containing protein [Flavobacterium sp.]HRZ73598.1 lysylphosphatidylglycerol synthase transmembrane domain-containing protein [Flavobacterium sp.]